MTTITMKPEGLQYDVTGTSERRAAISRAIAFSLGSYSACATGIWVATGGRSIASPEGAPRQGCGEPAAAAAAADSREIPRLKPTPALSRLEGLVFEKIGFLLATPYHADLARSGDMGPGLTTAPLGPITRLAMEELGPRVRE